MSKAKRDGKRRPRNRTWTYELAAQALGDFDRRSLRFFDVAQRAAASKQSHPGNALLPEAEVEVTDVRLLGSFNWTGQASGPAVIIPGSPPIWRNSPLPFTLQSDLKLCQDNDGIVYDDSSAGTGQSSTILAMLAAVNECTPPGTFKWSSSDIIADRTSLRHLLGWAGGAWKPRDFRIDLSLVGERSIVFTRWKKNTRERASKGSYGSSYEAAQTRPSPGCEVTRRVGHDRIVSYTFGGLRIVCRGEADACAPPSLSHNEVTKKTSVKDRPSAGSLGPLKFRRAGQLVPQEHVLELTTCTTGRISGQRRNRKYAQLVLGAMNHLKIATHDGHGRFFKLEEEIIGKSPRLAASAACMQPSFKRLRVLLAGIQALAVQHGKGTQLTLLKRGRNRLEVFVRNRPSFIPAQFKKVFV